MASQRWTRRLATWHTALTWHATPLNTSGSGRSNLSSLCRMYRDCDGVVKMNSVIGPDFHIKPDPIHCIKRTNQRVGTGVSPR